MDVNGRLIDAQRAMSKTLIDPTKKPLPTRPQNSTRRLGKILGVNWATGQAQVELDSGVLDGVHWLAEAYAPKVNDFVWVEYVGGRDPMIIGRQHNGTSNTSQWIQGAVAGSPIQLQANWGKQANTDIWVRRVGEMVFFNAQLALLSGTANTVAFQFPVGYRPISAYWGCGYYNCEFYVTWDGWLIPILATSNTFSMSGAFAAYIH